MYISAEGYLMADPIRIMLVEDHPVMRRAYAMLLSRQPGLDLIGSAESAEDCIAQFEPDQYDVLLTDYSLPGMDGLALLKQLQADRPDLPAVVISAHEGPDIAARAESSGASAYLPKRYIPTHLVPTIQHVIAGGTGTCPTPIGD